ncbi:Bax inhibitor-1/YccA family protein [Glaciimonas sp. PAMC28666]|nr:Bax inhibitor-1/YccA family protein [Glaciimonas sp. PAMC28666]
MQLKGAIMNSNQTHRYAPTGTTASISGVRNRVLRNTYWLLALSMIPTIGGAWVGVQLNFNLFSGSPMVGFIAFMAIAFGFFYAIEKTKDTGWGVVVLLAFTFFMGLMLTRLIEHTLRFSNGGTLIMMAFGGTGIVFGVMATIATVSKRDFSGLGKWLFAGVIVIIVASVANIFLQIPALYLAVSVIAIAIFSAYILYDVQQIINGGETNYVRATLSIYLDVYNIFVNLLSLLGIFGGNRN